LSNRGRWERLLRWYPPQWHQRYGDELIALLEDSHADGSMPLRGRVSMARAGSHERLRSSGLFGTDHEPAGRVKAASLLVLCGWAVFIVAGAGFAKFSEHWDAITPVRARWLPAHAYDAVQWAAATGAMIVVVAAAFTVPSCIRCLRHREWAPVRRHIRRAAVITAVTALLSAVVVLWAHHLGPRQRNGGLLPFRLVGVVWVSMIVATIVTCTIAGVAMTRRLRLGDPILRLQGAFALMLALGMSVIFGGTLVWWISLAEDAPWFFSGVRVGTTASPVPPAMVISGFLMLVGTVAALYGGGRIARSLPLISTSRTAGDPTHFVPPSGDTV
jgi:hypothetical protein